MEESNFFGGEGIWLFAILAFMWGGNGLFGGNRVGEQYATQADIQRAVDLDTLKSGQAGITSAVKDASYNNLGEVRDVQAAVASGFANMQNCCCETNRNIDSVKFDMANYVASINATSTANAQKILDAMSADKIASLQAQVNKLETQNMFCGIPRINTYGYGIAPQFATCGCNCGNI